LDAPYVQVVLVRGSGVLGPEHWTRAIAPPPERNSGSPTQITVPTWGLSATDGTFVLLACEGADSSSCTTVLASETRHIVQTAPAAGSLDMPAQPAFIPEEQVLVSADNSGGGEMVAQFRGVRGRDVVPAGDTVVLTAYPATSAVEQLDLQRCSTLTASPNYCEPPVASEALSFVTGIEVNPVFGEQLPRITVDPAWHSSTAEVAVYTTGQSHRLSWSLYDAQGEQVVAPVNVPVGTSGLDQVEISPGAHAAGTLSDGVYTVRFDVTVSKGDLTRTGSAQRQIEIINDPPTDRPRILSARRTWRPVAGWGRAVPRFRVQAYRGSYATGTLRVRNSRGRVIADRQLTNPCLSGYPGCTSDPVWDVDFDDLGTLVPRPGAYTAELVMPDSYGRMMVRDLGTIDIQQCVSVQRTTTAKAGRALLRKSGNARVYQLRVPTLRNVQWLGNLVARVRPVADEPRGIAHARIPVFSDRWRAATKLGPRSRWATVPLSRWPGYDEGLPTPLGKKVQIRVKGDRARSRVDRIALTVAVGVWRSSLD
jgi:hypothetical protein